MFHDDDTDYIKFRGKCKEMSEKFIKDHPELNLELARGWYHCPFWGKQEHWWCVEYDGKIHDPTAKQFPSKGLGHYEEYIGVLNCEYCSEEVKEEDVYLSGHHVYCNYECAYKDVLW